MAVDVNNLSRFSETIQERIRDIINNKQPLYAKRVKETNDAEVGVAIRDAGKEFGEVQSAAIQREFFATVRAFYNSYKPKYYHRSGDNSTQSGGLYDLLNITLDAWGRVAYSTYDDLLNPAKMTVDRKGHSLYKKVFQEGWHGGAESGEGHPKTGTPYWRTPYPTGDKTKPQLRVGFMNWGKRAKKSKVSPYDRFIEQLHTISSTELQEQFRDIYIKHFKAADERTVKQAKVIAKEIFG